MKNEICIDEEIKGALIGLRITKLGMILDLVISYETGDWDKAIAFSKQLNLEDSCLLPAYLKSLEWSQHGSEI